MKVVYVAGPYRAADNWLIEQNIRRSEEMALEIWRLGHVGISPHKLTQHYQYHLPDDVWLKGDLEILSRCDAVILLQGWENSSGTKAEIEFALRERIPVFKDLEILKKWLAAF